MRVSVYFLKMTRCVNVSVSKSKVEYYIDLAIKTAEKSNGYYKHGAVVVYRSKIMSTSPNVYFNNFQSRPNTSHPCNSLHSEVGALLKLRRDQLKDCVVYVVRINNTGQVCNSKPCSHCMKTLSKYKIRTVYYS